MDTSTIAISFGAAFISILLSLIAFFLKELHSEVKRTGNEMKHLTQEFLLSQSNNINRLDSHERRLNNHSKRIKNIEITRKPSDS